MERTALQKIFSKTFDDSSWLEVLHSVFGAKQLLAQQKAILLLNKEKAEAAFELGSFTTSDDRIIGLYKIEIRPEVWLERNKVGLRALLRDIYKYDVDGAIIVFVQGAKWRLSFVSEIKVLNDEGEVIKQATEPKRYTYLLGDNEKVRTPSDRLSKLSGKILSLKDILNAFSVEALNEEFYKIIQGFFYNLIGGETSKGKKVTNHGDGILQLPGASKENRQIYQEFAVRLIGRTVFCWFLKMKKTPMEESLLPEKLLSSEAVKANRNYYHNILERLFFQTLNAPMEKRLPNLPVGSDKIPFLNGGLFEHGEQDYFIPSEITGLNENFETLEIKDQWFINFFEELEKYNFTIDENSVTDVEVSVDPEMLGRIFENLLAEIDPDSRATARKATGSFYTPREIVDYMATESLVQYLHNKTTLEQEKIRPLFKMTEQELPAFTPSEKENILDALDKIKILDPACGSGAFPMGILQKTVQALQKLDKDAEWWIERQVNVNTHPVARQAVREKLQSNPEYARKIGIIQNSLFGVDIQPIAAEISKLRCFLTLIVDENINDTLPNRGIEPLPNLEFKFVTADTLIKLPEEQDFGGLFNSNDDLAHLETIRQDYLQSYGPQKGLLKHKFKSIHEKIAEQQTSNRAVDVNSRAYLISTWNPFEHAKSNWFDTKWMFGVEKFDIVIGNPPYVQLQKEQGRLAKLYSKQNYKTFLRTGDLYILFIERSHELLKSDGVLAFINPNTWLQSFSFGEARKYFVNSFDWIQIMITDKIFSATVDTHCLIFSKLKSTREHITILRKTGNKISISHYVDKIHVNTDGGLINIEIGETGQKLIDKIRLNRQIIGQSFTVMTGVKPFQKGKGKPPQTAEIVQNKPFVHSGSKIDDSWMPLLRGSLINRYKLLWNQDYWIQYGEWLAEPRDKRFFKASEKIVVRQTGDSLIATFLGPDHICRDNLYMIIPNSDQSIFGLLGIINSKTMNYYYSYLNPEKGEALAQVKKNHLNVLPLPDLNKTNTLNILVKYVLKIYNSQSALNPHVSNTHIALLFEEVIDAVVMELFFKDDFENVGIEFIKYIERDFCGIDGKPEQEQTEIIHEAYQKLREKDNEIRNNLKLMDIKLGDIVLPIKSAK